MNLDQPELAILLLCLSYENIPGKIERLAGVHAQQWRSVSALAQRLQVAALLRYRLKQIGVALPQDAAEELKQAFLTNTARNMQLYQELGNLLECLNAQNIPAILLKGAYLADAVYDHIGLRTMGDIDLLIPESQLERAIELAKTSGFTPERQFFPETDGILMHHAPPMLKKGIRIELHWRLRQESDPIQINIARVWARASRIKLQGNEAWALDPNDLLLHLAVHASYGHKFAFQFRSLFDMVEVLRKFGEELDWTALLQDCRIWQAERGLYLTLRLVRELFETKIPDPVLAALKPIDWNEKALEWARVRLFQTNPELSINYIHLMHNSKITGKLVALQKGLFPSRGVMAMVYGIPPDSWRITTLYPHHAVTRLLKYWKYARKLLRGDPIQASEMESEQSLRDWLGVI